MEETSAAAEKPVAGTQSLDRALVLLQEIARGPSQGLSLADCVRILGYSKPTVQRLLQALVRREFLHIEEHTETYTLGVANLRLAADYLRNIDVRAVALPIMRSLVAELEETAHLGILRGDKVVYIEVVDSPQPVRIFSRLGDASPTYASAIGKAILAFLGDSVALRHVPEILKKRTKKTFQNKEMLLMDLERIRNRGFAIDAGENVEGIRSYAAPIFDFGGNVIAAVSIGGPDSRVTEKDDDRMGALIVDAANQISNLLGS